MPIEAPQLAAPLLHLAAADRLHTVVGNRLVITVTMPASAEIVDLNSPCHDLADDAEERPQPRRHVAMAGIVNADTRVGRCPVLEHPDQAAGGDMVRDGPLAGVHQASAAERG